VGPPELVDAGVIPSLAHVVPDPCAERKWLHLSVEIRIEEKRKREAICRARILHAMRRGKVVTAGYPLQDVTEIAHERARSGGRIDPLRPNLDLQAARYVLKENRKQGVIRMLTDA